MAPAATRRLHLQLSAFYFLYYAAVGVFIPYWSLYLHSRGYTAAQIGMALGLMGLVRVFSPMVWGVAMDRSGRRMKLIGAGMLAAAVLFSLIPFCGGFGWMLALHVAYAAFWNVGLPAFDVVTLNHIGKTGRPYTRIRLWGSIGFVVSVAAFGPILDRIGLWPVPGLIVAGMLGMGAMGWIVPDAADERPEAREPARFRHSLQRPIVLMLLLACFLSQLSFAPFYGFFSLLLVEHGYDRTAIGLLWAFGVLCEIVVFLHAGELIGRFGARRILLFALGSTTLRWAALALWVDTQAMVVFSQFLHFSSFGLYHAVSVHYIHRLFPGRLQGRGQALLAAASFGLGGSLGSYASGVLWDASQGRTVFLLAAAVAAAGATVAWLGVEAGANERRPHARPEHGG